MVGIDNSVKVAKLISDLNSTIENLKDENRALKGTIDGQRRTAKLLRDELHATRYACEENRQLVDNYASEAYEWQKKYYHEKEKHARATKKINCLQHTNKNYESLIKSLRKNGYGCNSTPKHAKKTGITVRGYINHEISFAQVKEEILDRCDFIDYEINAWWRSRISIDEAKDAVVDNLREIRDLAEPYSSISNTVNSLSTEALTTAILSDYDEDSNRDIQEAVDKIRQTIKEAE